MKSCDDNDRQFRTKHMAHISATGINMKRRREREDDICPRCEMGENNTHIYECTTDETTDIYETCCLEIEVTVDSKRPRGMALAIRELSRAARSQTEPNFDYITQHGIQRLARQQLELGSQLYNGEYSIAIGLTKLQQNGMMDDDVHINGWHPYPPTFRN